MGELFDRFVAVDWSAAARPVSGPNSVWIAVAERQGAAEPRLSNPSTRRRAERELAELVAGPARTLVAIDASFGYPCGTAAWFGLRGDDPWRAAWAHLATELDDSESNANNRFHVAAALNRRRPGTGPFWGRPRTLPIDGLACGKPARFPLPEFRGVEEGLRAAGRRPASVWQLAGAGSVGSQTLTLLPVLHRLHAAGWVDVWPFSTGLAPPRSRRSLVVETWPTAFDLDLPAHLVRDAAQVRGVVRRLRAADELGELAGWFGPQLAPAERQVVESEEGWVLSPPTAVRTAPAG